MSEQKTDSQCTGPFSDAFDCPVHDPRRQPASLASGSSAPQEGERAAFKAGFLAVWNSGTADKPAGWTFDGPAAADLEPRAWEAWRGLTGEASSAPPDLRQQGREDVLQMLSDDLVADMRVALRISDNLREAVGEVSPAAGQEHDSD